MHPCCRKVDTFEKAQRRIKKSLGVLTLQDNYPSASSPFISQVFCGILQMCLVAKSCPTLCNPMVYSPPGSSVHGISQARILEWVAISFFREIFSTQGSNLCLLHWQADSLLLNHQGSPTSQLLLSNGCPQGVLARVAKSSDFPREDKCLCFN